MFTKYYNRETYDSIYQELQQYKDIDIVDSSIRFNKSNILSTINKEFNHKNGRTRTFGQDSRQFFLYIEYLPYWTKSICTVLEKGMFFMLPELLADLIDLSIMQYHYYGEGNKRYFFMFHRIARNTYGFNIVSLEKYFDILELWDLQNCIEEVQSLIDNILSSNELKSIDLKFLKIIAPVLDNKQQVKIAKYAREFFENPKIPYGDNNNTFGLWREYLRVYFTILELNQSLWEVEQEWIITRLCKLDRIQHSANDPIPYIERLIQRTKFPLSNNLLDELCELIKNQTDYTGNSISEFDFISSISNLHTFYGKELPKKYKYIFREYPLLWLYSNRDTMNGVTSEDVEQSFKYIIKEFNEYYKNSSMDKKDEFTFFRDEYYNIPQYISLYLSLIEEYKDKIDYKSLCKDAEKLWSEFLDFCMKQDSIPLKLLLEVQIFIIYFASEKKFEEYHNIEYYINFDNWEYKVNTYSMQSDEQENKSSMFFLSAILHHIYDTDNVVIDSFHKALNTISWYKYNYCLQGIVNWKNIMPDNIKQLLKIEILDIISSSQKELIDTNIITVYNILFKNEEDIKSLLMFKDICSFLLYYDIIKK